ncbi:hypothetical protein AZH53_02060 [Methanomicrobiaceae archaeon CYW5]|uniref:hypothetical protein n=1 Tax=Methanovulcanius yangii TaxID=1789227 RepID=UPI0029CA5B25|nr:hypothetical protein [Methanovulcanius yangii]MBT8507213.1 hypothetical protein [Methanovulcanius yangii]
MIQDIAYYAVYTLPVVVVIGAVTLLSFVGTASIPILNRQRKEKIPIIWHIRMAQVSFILAIVHGLLAASIYMGF